MTNKKKIINDPLYGFLTIPYGLLFDLIEHPYFQRLRRIKQLGLSHLVYPGALHTRFHHALGALKLTLDAIENLRIKDISITDEEAEATSAAILLHDIGHGPFSHALESSLVSGLHHETISLLFMERLNAEMGGRLDMAIAIFTNTYPKKYLHQLISSQLDMDRMDYLMRDSFYTGVSEGIIGADRIIKMLHVAGDELVVEEKGIYSVEKFLIARRLMYWQVYLHKTVIAAEMQLVMLLRRARELVLMGKTPFCTPALSHFLSGITVAENFAANPQNLDKYAQLDDYDIFSAIKIWMDDEDPTLSYLSKSIINRRLPKIKLQNIAFTHQEITAEKEIVAQRFGLESKVLGYYVYAGSVFNHAYSAKEESISILQKNGAVIDIAQASENYNFPLLQKVVEKFYLVYPK